MTPSAFARPGRTGAGIVLLSSVLTLGACQEPDRLGPTPDASDLAVTAAPPVGIMFGSAQLPVSLLSSVHTGLIRPTEPGTLLSYLRDVKAKGGRVLLKLHGAESSFRNSDGTFNVTLWKSRVSRYRTVNFNAYITDGTVVGHYILDEPNYPSRWGGKAVPQATVEEMAKYSKQLWPNLATIVNAPPAWLASSSMTYTGLDAAWAMFMAEKSGTPTVWAAKQVELAKRKRLGLWSGLNVLDGGNGSSGVRGTVPRGWNMSAAELRSYGSALLGQSYVCGFSMWMYKDTYYNKADIKTAMAELSARASGHAKTSCRQ